MSPSFTRPDVKIEVVELSAKCLPTLGSSFHAFVDMLFMWGEEHELDPKYRHVTLPKGFVLTDLDAYAEIRNKYGYPRAFIRKGGMPLISPVKRFEPGAEKVEAGWRMTILDWGEVLVRGKVFDTEIQTMRVAETWLDEMQPGWRSFTSGVNFIKKPPR